MDKPEILDNLKDSKEIVERLDLPGIYTTHEEYMAIINLVAANEKAIKVFGERKEQ